MIEVADASAQERDKYSDIWSRSEYRKAHSPGVENVDRFMSVMKPRDGSTVIDVGCGSGHAGLELASRGLTSYYMDITDAGLDPAVPKHDFYQQAAWAPWPGKHFDYGFCCDVLEHIPPEYALLVCDRIISRCTVAWLQICNEPDNFGPALIGEPLHLTVKPFSWWKLRLAALGRLVEARDLCGVSLFVVAR